MRQNQFNSARQKYEVKAPPSFVNFYTRMEQERNKNINKNAKQNQATNNLDRYKVINKPQTLAQNRQKIKARSAVQQQAKKAKNNKKATTQYRMYLNDTKNVFYEERDEAKLLGFYQMIKPLINKVFIFLFLAWTILFFVRPYNGLCPLYADCGVYIHCHQGYVLRDNKCIVSEQTKQQANLICEAVVENLKFQYGNEECSQDVTRPIPSKTIDAVIQQYSINNKAVQSQIQNWFSDIDKQKKFNFNFKIGQISPKSKQFTIYCKFHKLVRSKGFYWYFSALLIAVLSILVFVKIKFEKKRAQKIFDYLKKKVQKQNQIIINFQQIQKNFGKIYAALWQNIDNLRIQDQSISFYEDQQLHWKLI